jgi:RNA polymerase sigma factor (sigma-70 family)
MKAMPPPVASAEQLASRLFLGPALRTQSDRRLVTLVREGYEAAFEEIVRRYRKPLGRFAVSFVGDRGEDVTQDAFSKALLALRGSEQEIELRPWLYRIVRNTALNDLRDSPPATVELGETMAGARSTAEEVERREELTELTDRLRALPDPQRAAIVMRELEGLSHEEIAAALGMSGGGARQAIYRGRQALRDGFGLLLPLPLLRLLADHGAEAAAGAGAGGAVAAGAAGAAGGAAGTAGALGGAGGALKVGLATVLIAGSVGAGVAVEQRGRHDGEQAETAPAEVVSSEKAAGDSGGPGSGPGLFNASSAEGGEGNQGEGRGPSRKEGEGDRGEGDDRGSGNGRGGSDEGLGDLSGGGGHGPEPGHGGPGPGGGGDDGRGGGRGPSDGGDHSGGGSGHETRSGGDPGGGHSPGGGSHSGGGGSDGGHSGGGSGGSGGGSGSPGSGGGSGSSGSGGGGPSGSAETPPPPPLPPPPEEESGGSGSGEEKDS